MPLFFPNLVKFIMVGHASVFQAQKWCYLTLLGAHIELTDVSVALVV